VERVVLNALKKRLRRLIFAPPATGSASVFGEADLLFSSIPFGFSSVRGAGNNDDHADR
jgi:hypothetical protein